jgi:NAD(P)-dependent dehydrogenase (short-subunit alcohol dehydrogenase family)/GMP synthase-like glutamine amidotransferase
MTGRIEGKVAVITGGCSGIGLATVRRFVAEGAKVVVGDIADEAGGRLVEELGGASSATYAHVDVTNKAEVDALFKVAKDTYGSVDIAFNNAGISPPEDDSILTTELEAWRMVQEVNLTSVYLCCKAALPYMLEQGKGSIINTASFVAVMGAAASQISYSASKGGVLSMTREMGVRFAREGVRVNALYPGPREHPAAAGAVRQGPGAGRAPAGAHPDGQVRRARGDGRRGALPRLGRLLVHDRQHLPRRRRHLGRLRDAGLSIRERISRGEGEGETSDAAARRHHDLPGGGGLGRVAAGRRRPPGAVRPRRRGGRGESRCCYRRSWRPTRPRPSSRASTASSWPAVRADRDSWELALIGAAGAVGLPLLGVCRGMQLLAVQAGGALEQHTPDRVGDDRHSPGGDAFGSVQVQTVAGTRLAGLVGPALTMNCHHHQAVAEHPGFAAAAWSAEGTLEAIEDPGSRFRLGVQWHPETAVDAGLFAGLVAACRLGLGLGEGHGLGRDAAAGRAAHAAVEFSNSTAEERACTG